VVKARDGSEAVERAHKEKPDLAILDVTMPKMNGFEAAKELRSKLETAVIPIILLTGRQDKESELRGIDAGADDYITKPFDADKLLARIKMLLRRKER
jgi:DNA-binding response OmpR family regulator